MLPDPTIRRAPELLQNIAAGLNLNNHYPLSVLEVVLYEGDEVVLRAGVATVLDYLANDIFYDD